MLVAAYSAGPLAGNRALGYLVQKAGYMALLEHRGLCSNKMWGYPVCVCHCRQDTVCRGLGAGLLMSQGYNGRVHVGPPKAFWL